MKKLLLIAILLFALPVYAKDFAIENGTVTLLNVTSAGNIFLVPSGGFVGIGTTVMSQLLTVAGNANITGTLYAAGLFGNAENLTGIGNSNISILYGANASNQSQLMPARVSEEGNLMFSIREGTGTGWDRVSGNIYPSTLTDNVGIGTANPTFKLDVNSVINASGLLINGSAMTSGSTSLPAANITAGTFGSGLFTFPSGLNITQGGLLVNGNVGIGTTGPSQKFHIYDVGTTPRIRIGASSGYGDGYVSFYSDGASNANDYLSFGANTYDSLVVKHGGNVGIGSVAPASTLEVNGTVRITPTATGTCNAAVEGSIFYNITEKHMYMCNSTNWLRLDNTYI